MNHRVLRRDLKRDKKIRRDQAISSLGLKYWPMSDVTEKNYDNEMQYISMRKENPIGGVNG